MKNFFLLNWLKNVSIARKLYFVVGIMALLIAIELFALTFMIHTLSSARALVGAEGLWSKAEKDAVYSLSKYGYTHNEKDYNQYLHLLAVPLGDRRARLALMKPNPDIDSARAGLLAGRIYPDDIDGIIRVLTRFKRISYIYKAIEIWARGDNMLAELQYLGNKLHRQVSTNASNAEINQTLDEIFQLNEKLTFLEDDFSYTLGEGSRWIEHLILKILFSIAITVEFTGLFLTVSVSRAISGGIDEIVHIAKKVSNSDFSARAKVSSGDEIGLLAASFNRMTDILKRNISEQKKTEEVLKEQKDLYETLLKTESEMGEGVTITEEQKIIYVNDAVCNIYGYSREKILAMSSFLEIVPDEEKPVLMERLKQRIDGNRAQSAGETKIIRGDGKIIDLEYTVRNLIREGRLQMISIIRDITDKKHAEEELNIERQRAERAEIAKKVGEQFLANMSHEIRTPMNAILGFTNVLLKSPLTEEQQKYLNAVKISGDNLLVIINDILDFSKMRSGKMILEQKEFSLSAIISNTVEMMMPKAQAKKLRLFYMLEKDIPDNLLGDYTRLSQVLINLVANAIKFTETGEVGMHIRKLSETDDSVELEISVKDTGVGIPEDRISNIFDPFVQANSDTARRYGGTGLGLSIVKQLAELQGGTISVTSKEGEGSDFVFRIIYLKNEAPSGKAEPPVNETEPDADNLNILLVEDNEMNQILAKKILNDKGWNVQVAGDADSAFKFLKYNNFDIILMDIQLPGMDGYEATRIIRTKLPKPQCDIPIIAMTAHVMASEKEKCFQVGMNDYISKPFNENILFHKITTLGAKTT